MTPQFILSQVLSCLVLSAFVPAQTPPQKMPREDVLHVPARTDDLCLSNLFQSNMVLQRDKPTTVWGWATPGEKIAVSFGGQTIEATAGPDRFWQATLQPMPADANPREMTVKGDNRTLTLENILLGDVWILGGQSNMEFELAKVDDGMLEMVSANFPQIRLLTMPQGKGFESIKSFERLHEWSDWSGRHFRKGDWEICTPEAAGEFSAIGYIFGRRLHMAAGVPIGLIDASRGGTTVETWTPEAVLREIDAPETKAKLAQWEEKIASYDPQADLEKLIANYERQKQKRAEEGNPLPADSKPPTEPRPGPIADHNRPGHCYAGMIKPLEGLAVKGAVFHQGFNNCFDGSAGARMYRQVFGKMITAWRANFHDDQMPFCIISLCTAGEPQTREQFLTPMNDIGALIREAQYQTFREFHDAGDETIGFVSSFDLRKSWYHPQIKIPAGERAAKWALASQYEILQGRDAIHYWMPPVIEQVERVDGTIRLTMSTPIQTRDDSDGKMIGFAIAGDDRRFYPADIDYYTDGTVDDRKKPKYQRNVLVLTSPYVPEPTQFRHAWARNPMTNLVNPRQIPLATQRSDDWLPEETPITIPVPPDMDDRASAGYVKGRLAKELTLADTERQIREAEDTIARLKEKFTADKEAWEKSKAADAEKIRVKQAAESP